MAEAPQRWTFEAIRALAEAGVPEGSRHDFKRDLPDSLTLSKACCAFANSEGGALIFGVAQREGRWAVEGLPVDKEFAGRFGQKVRVTPSIAYEGPQWVPIPGSALALAVVDIPPSGLRPHVPRQEQALFLKRTGAGNEFMSLEEIRGQFQQAQRRQAVLGLLAHELEQALDIVRLLHSIPNISTEPDDFDLGSLDLLFREAFPFLVDDPALVGELSDVRRQMRRTNRAREMVSALIASNAHRFQEVESRADDAIRLQMQGLDGKISGALEALRGRHGVARPPPSPGGWIPVA